jgi:hypothetical protein
LNQQLFKTAHFTWRNTKSRNFGGRFFGDFAGLKPNKILNFVCRSPSLSSFVVNTPHDVATEPLTSFTGMNPLPLTTSQNEENTAQSRWESEGGNPGELRAFAADNQEELVIPVLVSTEEAIRWGSHLNASQHTTLVEKQRALSTVALAEHSMQRMVNLATQSQLLREAAEAFMPRAYDAT